jgi:hypothetical protein
MIIYHYHGDKTFLGDYLVTNYDALMGSNYCGPEIGGHQISAPSMIEVTQLF